MQQKKAEAFAPKSKKDWREWLILNHLSEQSVWLVCYKVNAGKPTISWSDAVDEALCFGWIDGIRKTIDDETFTNFFTKRKTGSAWSKINKAKVERLIAEDLMMEAGYQAIEIAKQNGSWEILDEVEALVIPKDLVKAFRAYPGSKLFFSGLSKSVKKMLLQWIVFAKRPETRQRRINEVAEKAGQGRRPAGF